MVSSRFTWYPPLIKELNLQREFSCHLVKKGNLHGSFILPTYLHPHYSSETDGSTTFAHEEVVGEKAL